MLSRISSKVMLYVLPALFCYSLGISYLYTQGLEKRAVVEGELVSVKLSLERSNKQVKEILTQHKADLQIKESLCKKHEERRSATDADKSEIDRMVLEDEIRNKEELTSVPKIQSEAVTPANAKLPDALIGVLDKAYERNRD